MAAKDMKLEWAEKVKGGRGQDITGAFRLD